MEQILIGSLTLSVLHILIPSHWIPLITVGKTEHWSRRETLQATALAGVAHTMSTILIGLVIGFAGYRLSSAYQGTTKIVASLVLIALGSFYLAGQKHRSHQHGQLDAEKIARTSKLAIIASLSVMMFFSPCPEIEAYYFAAGLHGWSGIGLVSIIYFVVTILGMLFLVDVAYRGTQKLRLHFFEQNEKLVTGTVLVVFGVLNYALEI